MYLVSKIAVTKQRRTARSKFLEISVIGCLLQSVSGLLCPVTDCTTAIWSPLTLRGGGANPTVTTVLDTSQNSTKPSSSQVPKKRARPTEACKIPSNPTQDDPAVSTIPRAKKDPNGETYFEVIPKSFVS
jgi:hypothetical protein